MNNRHRATLAAIFAHPTPSNIRWKDAVGLFKALGATIDESREGSRVAFPHGDTDRCLSQAASWIDDWTSDGARDDAAAT
jgi:hypothetical protein